MPPPSPYPVNSLPNEMWVDFGVASCQFWKSNAFTSVPNTLGTNYSLWPWPANLSCEGNVNGYQQAIIGAKWVLGNGHINAALYTNTWNIQYTGTNGVSYTNWFAGGNVHVAGDLWVCPLQAPVTNVALPYILPNNYTNYFPSHSPVGMPFGLCHKNTGGIEAFVIKTWNAAGEPANGWYLTVNADTVPDSVYPYSNPFAGTSSSSGDSGSLTFIIWKNQIVVLGEVTAPIADFCGVSDSLFYAGITNAVGITNLNIMPLSGYPTY